MRLASLLTAALLPIGLIAAPAAEVVADVVARESLDTSAKAPADNVFKRNMQLCDIVNASVVNCRSGPGTNYKVVRTYKKGDFSSFTCFKSGDCVTDNGSVNCGWDFTPFAGDNGCYINGHYTDSHCTSARLDRCK